MMIWMCSDRDWGTRDLGTNGFVERALVQLRKLMVNDPAIIDEMLSTAKTIAVVGMSDKTWRASHNIGRYLAGVGYRVLPVNPTLASVLDMQCYPDLASAEAA